MVAIDFHSIVHSMEVNGYSQLFSYQHSSKYLILCSTEERNSYRFGTTLRDFDRIFFFGRTIPLSHKRYFPLRSGLSLKARLCCVPFHIFTVLIFYLLCSLWRSLMALPLTYCLAPTCSPLCIHFVCMPVCYLYSLLHPELHWTQRIKETWKYEWDQSVFWWCTDTQRQRYLTNINASLLGRVLSWVPVFPVLELIISGFLFSKHYHHNTLKNNSVIYIDIYIYTHTHIFPPYSSYPDFTDGPMQ